MSEARHAADPAFESPLTPAARLLRVVTRVAGGVLAIVVLVGIGVFAGLRLGAPSEVEIPDVRGQEVGLADALLREQGFLIALEPTVEGDVPLHTVIGTDPPPGTIAEEGDFVTLSYRDAPDTGIVPPIAQLPQKEAELLLRQAGLAVGAIRREANDDVPEGHIITCIPEDGIVLPRDAPVALVVSSGPAR